jgi:hypothetical protein
MLEVELRALTTAVELAEQVALVAAEMLMVQVVEPLELLETLQVQ